MKELLKRLALLTFAVLITLLGLEIILRALPPPAQRPAADRSPIFYEPAPERNHPWSRDAGNVLRIAVIGDSFTRGVGVQIDDRYAARMERILNLQKDTVPVEVRVYARSGTATFQQLGMLREALAEKPAIVILGICLNDTEDWTQGAELRAWRDEWMPGEPAGFQAFLIRHSRTAGFFIQRGTAARSAHRGVQYYRHLYDPDYSGIRRFRKAIETFRDECAAQDAAFVPFIFPLLSYDFAPGRYPLQFAHDRIQQIGGETGVRFHDLLPAFQGTSPERMQAIPVIDPHPSEIAHRIAAESIVNYLLDEGHVSGDYRPAIRPSGVRLHAIWNRTIQRFQPGQIDPHVP